MYKIAINITLSRIIVLTSFVYSGRMGRVEVEMTLRAITLIGILGIIGLMTSAQEAKVILLTPSDATRAELKYKELLRAQAAWEQEQEILREKYLTVSYNDPEAGQEVVNYTQVSPTTLCGGHIINYAQPTEAEKAAWKVCEEAQAKESIERQKHSKYGRKGWSGGFEFSSDFRFIVPKKDSYTPTQGVLPCVNWTH